MVRVKKGGSRMDMLTGHAIVPVLETREEVREEVRDDLGRDGGGKR